MGRARAQCYVCFQWTHVCISRWCGCDRCYCVGDKKILMFWYTLNPNINLFIWLENLNCQFISSLTDNILPTDNGHVIYSNPEMCIWPFYIFCIYSWLYLTSRSIFGSLWLEKIPFIIFLWFYEYCGLVKVSRKTDYR